MSLQREILSPVTTNLENSLIRVCRPSLPCASSTSNELTSLIDKGSADCKFLAYKTQKQSAQHGKSSIFSTIFVDRIQTPISNGGRLRSLFQSNPVRPELWFRKLLKVWKFRLMLRHTTLLMLCHTRLHMVL